MILFLVKKRIYHVMVDYLQRVQGYLEERFDLDVDIISFINATEVTIKDNHRIVIFVQHIDPTLIHQLRSSALKRRVQERISGEQQLRKVFLLNTEQATMTRYVGEVVAEIKKYNVPVIDYSMENITILQKKLPTTVFIHFPFPIQIVPVVPKTISIVSLQSSSYRKRVCSSIKMPVADFFRKWGAQRDAIIRKSKILLNIHYKPGEYNIFESIRCYHALEMHTLVISEPSADNNKVLLKDFIIFATAAEMPKKVQEVLDNYQVYYDQCFSPARLHDLGKRYETVYRSSIEKLMSL